MLIRVLLIMLGVTVMIFTSHTGIAAKVPPYNTVIRNIGTKKISNSIIIFNKRKLTAGWVTPGNYKVRVNPSTPIPDKAIVSWRREDNTEYEREIEIKSKLTKLVDKQEYYFIVDIDDNENVKLLVVICNPGEYWGNKLTKGNP